MTLESWTIGSSALTGVINVKIPLVDTAGRERYKKHAARLGFDGWDWARGDVEFWVNSA